MTENEAITGTIIGIRDCGSLVLVFLEAEEGRVVPVPMDHRAFQHLLEGEACNSAGLVGRGVAYDGDLVTFLD